jgi:hypothetical protein
VSGTPPEVRLAEVRPEEIRPAKVRPGEDRSGEIRPLEGRPAEVRSEEVRPAEICPVEDHIAEVCHAEVRPVEVRPAEIRSCARILLSPLIPGICSFLKESKMLFVWHVQLTADFPKPESNQVAEKQRQREYTVSIDSWSSPVPAAPKVAFWTIYFRFPSHST